MASDVTETDRFVFFWGGWPSQWFKCGFEVDGTTYNCCEQFMMAEKARFFGDQETLTLILDRTNPRAQKALGRMVRNFDQERWNKVCRGIVYRGNLAKYEQDAELRESLLATGEKTIVEASPTDQIWGIGLSVDDERAHDPARWRGTNWLGVVLMQVREMLRPRDRGEPDPLSDRELIQQLKDRWTLRSQ